MPKLELNHRELIALSMLCANWLQEHGGASQDTPLTGLIWNLSDKLSAADKDGQRAAARPFGKA